MTTTTDLLALPEDTPLIHIVIAQGDDYTTATAQIESAGGSVQAAAEYLAQWDNGVETDFAAEVNGDIVTVGTVLGYDHQLHPARLGGIDYVVVIDHQMGLYSLYRLPLGQAETVQATTAPIDLHYRCPGCAALGPGAEGEGQATVPAADLAESGTPICSREGCTNFDQEMGYAGYLAGDRQFVDLPAWPNEASPARGAADILHELRTLPDDEHVELLEELIGELARDVAESYSAAMVATAAIPRSVIEAVNTEVRDYVGNIYF